MLRLDDLYAGYGLGLVLHGLSLEVGEGRIVALLGRNGVGKTTTLNTIFGLTRLYRGTITWQGQSIRHLPPHEVARRGIALVPQGRRIFPSLTVRENLLIGCRPPAGGERPPAGGDRRAADGVRAGEPQGWDLERVYQHFPILRQRANVGGAQLSGGEQQMLAIARALMTQPGLLLCDEPSEGLAPLMVRRIADILRGLKEQGLSILLVEQNVEMALSLADHVYVVTGGRVVYEGRPEDLAADEAARLLYLGVGR